MTWWGDVRGVEPVAVSAGWLLTFTDLIGLLLCFFVLFFSTKTLDVDAWNVLRGSMRGTFAVSEAFLFVPLDQPNNATVTAPTPMLALPYLQQVFAQHMASDPVWSAVDARYSKAEDRLDYSLPVELWRGDGLSALGEGAVDRLAAHLRGWRNRMTLEARVVASADMGTAMRRLEAVRLRLRKNGVLGVRRSELVDAPDAKAALTLVVHGEKSLCLGC